MTPKELKRLRRSDLLEMLLDLSRENDKLRKENHTLRQQLHDRTISIENSGSLAEAALQLNGIFEAAQAACEQYTENIRTRSETAEQRCRELEQQTQAQCDALLAKAREEARAYLENVRQTQENEPYAWLRELMDDGETT